MSHLINFVVGNNGAGKTAFLRSLAKKECQRSKVLVVCNTVYDKFGTVSGVSKISQASLTSRPTPLLKSIILKLRGEQGGRLNVIGKTLEYIGYEPMIILRCRHNHKVDVNRVLDEISRDETLPDKDAVLYMAKQMLEYKFTEIPLDLRGDSYQNIKALNLLSAEKALRRAKLIKGVDIALVSPRVSRGLVPIDQASSGELTLLTTLSFIMCHIEENTTLLIDEPENSLHPRWQREYVGRLLDMLDYFSPAIYIATHAPILVSGAQTDGGSSVRIIDAATENTVDLMSSSAPVEEILWDVFGTVTPANHFLSEQLVQEIASLSQGVTLSTVISRIGELEAGAYDPQQEKVFEAARQLALEVAGVKGRG